MTATALALALGVVGVIACAWGYYTARAPFYDDAVSVASIAFGAVCIGAATHLIIGGNQ